MQHKRNFSKNQKQFEYSVQRLYNGLASLRDYHVNKAIQQGKDIIITYGCQKMKIPHDEILKRGKKSAVTIASKFNGKEYTLIDFRFKPDQNNQQPSLFGGG